ncbi:WYL domain-containing protein [Alkalihalobacillus sp. LMS39]|uniref:helix-turn-helix transcriptional regulator n=1 Tax=Alkalihalobacillus sp. LMS39 TaxID=2924032 RepID=UPI001FB3A06E|nr:WYL domain-containing protein [Alkalihalobacillus sp. LMS39]UOE93717.1 WYL domain-containing protein [Alkalihalobacillus sp. LMS39]
MSENKTGVRLLALKEILLFETDEHHQLSIKELIEKLKMYVPEFPADAKTVKKYIHTLRDSGFDIIENTGKHGELFYSHQVRLFETYQLRLLIDPVLSARFITTEEKKYLVSCLKQLTSKQIAKTLPDPVVYQQSINTDYNLIKHHIDIFHEAISQKKIVYFQYGDYNLEKSFTLRHEGRPYKIKPHALIWESDFYYLIGDDVKYGEEENPRNYRLDRMRHVVISDESFTQQQKDLSEYIQHSFHMFGGQDDWITLQFQLNRVTLNGVFDKFGMDSNVKQVDEKSFLVKAKAKISAGLKAWILSWGSQVHVVSPLSLQQEIEQEIEKMIALYSK